MKQGKILVIISIVCAIGVFAGLIAFIGGGNVRHVPILLGEKVEQTVEFQKIDGELKLVGIRGISGTNPTLVMRADYPYFLTVLNNDTEGHRFYIEGIDANSTYVPPGGRGVFQIYGSSEGTYHYYDLETSSEVPLGKFISAKVCDFC